MLKKSSIERMYANGYGWGRENRFNKKPVACVGASPGALAHIVRFVEDDACVIYASNVRTGLGYTLHKDLSAILFGEKYQIPALRKQVELDPKVVDSYVSTHQHPNVTFTIVKRDGHLWVRIGSYYTLQYLMPLSETEFFCRDRYDSLLFVKDDQGQVSHVLIWGPEFGGPENQIECPKIR